MSDDDNKVFRVWLPLSRVGDDFQSCYEYNKQDPAEAFRALSNVYAEAASMCKRLAGVVKENPGYTAQGDAHMLWIEGPMNAMQPLIQEGIVAIEEFEEYEEAPETIDYSEDDSNDGLDDGCTPEQVSYAAASICAEEDQRILSALCSGSFAVAPWPKG